MKDNRPALMRIFSAVLKEKAGTQPSEKKISPQLLKHFTRKDLIEIITMIYEGRIPEELNKVETENERLLELIGDDLFIISYMTGKWCRESPAELPKTQDRVPPATGAKPNTGKEKKEAPETQQEKKE